MWNMRHVRTYTGTIEKCPLNCNATLPQDLQWERSSLGDLENARSTFSVVNWSRHTVNVLLLASPLARPL